MHGWYFGFKGSVRGNRRCLLHLCVSPDSLATNINKNVEENVSSPKKKKLEKLTGAQIMALAQLWKSTAFGGDNDINVRNGDVNHCSWLSDSKLVNRGYASTKGAKAVQVCSFCLVRHPDVHRGPRYM